MYRFPFIKKDELFEKWDDGNLWMKYCGFLDLSIDEFMVIQKSLLMDEIELIKNSELGKKILGNHKLENLHDFRKYVPFTTYDDYQPCLGEKNDSMLAAKPTLWAHTSGRTGLIKWIPYTQGNLERLADDTLSAFILSSASRRGEVRLHPGARVVLNLPPVPYTTGVMGYVAAERMSYRAIPPLDEAEAMEFHERIEQGFHTALRTGIDYSASLAVVLAKIGKGFSQLGNSAKLSPGSLHPMAILRLLNAILNARISKRPILPKDIWKVKGLVCGGTDTSIYQEEIANYWGVKPLDVYVATETCFIAMQSWNKKGMTLVPYSNFYEFIPEEEMLKNEKDKHYKPSTVLIDELEAGRIYEIVVTNFHGGPLVRYRIGDLVKVTTIGDKETGSTLPQITFQRRADDLIDISGFVRLDEKELWAAIQGTKLPYEDWTIRKESNKEEPVLHIYLEVNQNGYNNSQIAKMIDDELIKMRKDYRDLRSMIGMTPIKVTLLNSGTFREYTRKKQEAGFDIAHLKPLHINPSDTMISDLLQISDRL
ncbi:MAG: GH3 auxin-responsive promoter family protein [Dehalococcoidales bacterium]|nr:GH3 auxin-responsive promoter family protein [Dehalococcoidales bacterium]